MNKEFDLAVTAIWNKYGKYGMQKQEIAGLMKSGMENNSLSLRAVYNGMRMSLAMEFNEQENFTVEDIMDITGESREEVVKRIEEGIRMTMQGKWRRRKEARSSFRKECDSHGRNTTDADNPTVRGLL